MKYRMIFDGEHCRAGGFKLSRPNLIATFTHWEKDRNGFSDTRPLKSALDRDYGHLIIQTAQNDWYLNADLPAMLQSLHRVVRGRETIAIGFSMGGYGAIRMSGALGLSRALLVSPQYSVIPDKIPFDTKKRDLSRCITEYDSLDNAQRQMSGFVLFDSLGCSRDRDHARMIGTQFPKLRLAALPGASHPATQIFRESDGYGKLVNSFLDNTLTGSDIKALHRVAREHSETYADKMSRQLAKRYFG